MSCDFTFLKKEHAGVRIMQYPDEIVVYPCVPGVRRANGYYNEAGEVQVQRSKNRAKIEAARSRRAEKIIRGAVKVLAKNQGIFITVTTGVAGRHSGKISRLIDKMRKEYGLLYYVWVRELTKSGLVHWHFAAVFTKRGLDWVRWVKEKNRIVELSNWWVRQIGGKECGNSIRLGWDVRNGRPRKYLLDYKAAGYLVKYLRKAQRAEKGARVWTTNCDFLYPIRFDVYRIFSYYSRKRGIIFEPDTESEKRLAEYSHSPYLRKSDFWHRPPDFVAANAEFYAKIWRVPVENWDLRNLN